MAFDLDEGEKERMLDDLNRVGPGKPVGYLPLYTLRDWLQLAPASVAADARARGLAAAEVGPEACCIKSGALYVYDRDSLAKLLRTRTDTLAAHGMPLDPDLFVARIAAVWFETEHPVYPIIKAAFADPF